MLTTILIVVALLKESIPFFEDVGAAFFTDAEWSPLFNDPEFGIRPLLVGTFLITGIGILVAIPIGLGSAIYLSEYASPRTRRVVKPILEVLVGVPTIVFGYFALTFITPTLLQDILHLDVQIFNALAAGLIMGFMIVPTIASISEDSMSAVPQGLREGAYGLGATRRQVATKVVFPAAISGIVASIVLGVSRGVGETMIVLIAAGLSPNGEPQPARAARHRDRLHGGDGEGRQPRRDGRLPVDLRARPDAVRAHPADEHDRDPLRPQVQARSTNERLRRSGGRRRRPDQVRVGALDSRAGSSSSSSCLFSCIIACLVVLLVLLVQVFSDGLGALSLSFLTDTPSRIDPASSGIGPALAGTLWLMVVCTAFIIPVGVATAVYLEEYANRERWFNRFIEVNIQNLAAVPSIVYGVLGLAFLVRGPLSLGHVLLAGGLTLGLLVLPVLIVAGREAIRAVPPSIREGSMALGATKWQTIWKQVLPAALPGIATGAILSLSRAIGETAPLIVIGAAAFATSVPDRDLRRRHRAADPDLLLDLRPAGGVQGAWPPPGSSS